MEEQAIAQKHGKDGRVMNPRSLANLGPEFPKGRSPNPSGLPVNTPKVSVAAMKLAAMPAGSKFVPANKADEMALAWYNAILAGDMRALQMFLDRSEGPITQSLKIGTHKTDEELEAELRSYGVDLEAVMRMIEGEDARLSDGCV
jgi:hypothetical protein